MIGDAIGIVVKLWCNSPTLGDIKIQRLDAKNKIERYLDDREKDAFANLMKIIGRVLD